MHVGLMIEWVMVRGYDEAHRRADYNTVNAATPVDPYCPDVWTESKYQVFRRITDNSNAAMLHYGVRHDFKYLSEILATSFTFHFSMLATRKWRPCISSPTCTALSTCSLTSAAVVDTICTTTCPQRGENSNSSNLIMKGVGDRRPTGLPN